MKILPLLLLIIISMVGVVDASINITPPLTIELDDISLTINYSESYSTFSFDSNEIIYNGIKENYISTGTSNIVKESENSITVSGDDVAFTVEQIIEGRFDIYINDVLVSQQDYILSYVVSDGETCTYIFYKFVTTDSLNSISGYISTIIIVLMVTLIVSVLILLMNYEMVDMKTITIILSEIMAIIMFLIIYSIAKTI
jgi:hypothetical protein